MSSGPEYTHVEKPLLDQLAALGWAVVEGSKSDPTITERDSFRGSILETRLRAALAKINPSPGRMVRPGWTSPVSQRSSRR
jgi:type I restriction enzyme R subunit